MNWARISWARTGWVADLVLGVRLAVGGGRTSWARLALTAAGVGLGVTVLLLAASIGPAREAKSARVEAAVPSYTEDDSAPLRVRAVGVSWQGRHISGVELAAVGGGATPPPGVGRIPLPGEVVVSPALLELLAGDDSARARFPERVIGVIGDAGLPRPKSLLFYAGLPEGASASATPARGFGGTRAPQWWPPVYRLLVVAAIVALLVPLSIFVMVATRLGASGREQRLAAIRLAGGSRAQVHRIASGETLAGAVLGLFVGVALFFAARPLVRFIEVEGVGFFPTDLLPDPLLAVLIAVGVPVVAVGSALVGLRPVDVGPLGLSRRTEVPARRAWWRFALVGTGAAVLLATSLTSSYWSVMADPRTALALGAGIALVLAGTGAVLPWLVDRVSRARVEGIAPMLALRGLRYDRSTPRVLAGVVVVLTGSLALQLLLSAAADLAADNRAAWSTGDEERDRWVLLLPDQTPLRALEESIALVGGVRRVSEVRWGVASGEAVRRVLSTDCAELAHRLGVRDCAPGSAYWVAGHHPAPAPGTRMTLAGREWTVPAYQPLPEGTGMLHGQLVVAGGADPALSSIKPYELVVEGEPDAAFGDRLLAATGRVDRAVRLTSDAVGGQVELFTSLRSGVIGGSVLLTLLAVVGLAAAAVDQVWERRRPVAVLAANGVPRRTLAAAAVWQAVVPTALGVALAIPAGLGTAWLVVPSERFRVDWTELVVTAGTAAVVVLAVSLCTLPALRSAIHPSGLRAE